MNAFCNGFALYPYYQHLPEKSTQLSTGQCVFFSTKSAFGGINPLSWMKSLRDEILLRKVKGGGFHRATHDFIKDARLCLDFEKL